MAGCLFEKRDLSDLLEPISGSRVVFRCFDVSEHFFGLGSSSGDVYVFSRVSLRLLRRVAAASAKIDRVAFNPANDNVLCAASSRGELVVIEHNTMVVHSRPPRDLYRCDAHVSSTLTQLLWTRSGARFIGGDNRGIVSVTDLYSLSDAVLFEISPTNILTLDSCIVQIDTVSDRLVISTLSSSYLCDLEDRRFTKIGKKLRSGLFGACFVEALPEDGKYPDVYCVRPGGRLWQVNDFGEVTCTLSLRHEGSTDADHVPIPLSGTTKSETIFTKKIQFGMLFSMNELLITFSDEALYILQVQDCECPRVIWQTTSFNRVGLIEAKTGIDSIFFVHHDGAVTEWCFSSSILQHMSYILPTPEQRLTVILQNIDRDRVLQYLDLIRRQQFRGKELILRPCNLSIVPLVRDPRLLFNLSVPAFFAILRYLEGIFYSFDKRWYEPTALLVLPRQDSTLSAYNNRTSQSADGSTKDVPLHYRQSPKIISNNRYDISEQPPLSKNESASKLAHRKLLNRITYRLQKELADSLLVEMSSLLWATPPVLQGQHFIDSPLTSWGMRVDMTGDCAICGERLVMREIEEDLIVHFCGHLFHVTCSISDRLCCICMQDGSDWGCTNT